MNPSAPHSAYASAPLLPPLEVGMATDPGREPTKQVNEDACAARLTVHGHLAVVCDGMGGHVGGREASHLAIETIFAVFDATPPNVPPQQVLGDALRQANAAVFAKGQSSPELRGMGSTCVALLTHPGGSEIAHVGDSRIYLLTQCQIFQVTKDHSLVQKLVDANMLTPEQALNHPNSNQITNAFGQRSDVEVEIRPQSLPHIPGDTYLLCSDGLSDACGMVDFLQVLAAYPPLDVAARRLVDLANERGGHDNITVILVRLPGGQPFAPSIPTHWGSERPQVTTPPMGAMSTETTEMDLAGSYGTAAVDAYGPMSNRAAGVSGAPHPLAPTPMAPPMGSPTSTYPAPPAPFQAPPAFDPPAPPRRPRSSAPIVTIVLVVLVCLAGAGVAGWWFLLRGSNATPPEDLPDEPVVAPSAEPKSTVLPRPRALPPVVDAEVTGPTDVPDTGATDAPSASAVPHPSAAPAKPIARPGSGTPRGTASVPDHFTK